MIWDWKVLISHIKCTCGSWEYLQRSMEGNLHKSLICEPRRTAEKIRGQKRGSRIEFYKDTCIHQYKYANGNACFMFVCWVGVSPLREMKTKYAICLTLAQSQYPANAYATFFSETTYAVSSRRYWQSGCHVAMVFGVVGDYCLHTSWPSEPLHKIEIEM